MVIFNLKLADKFVLFLKFICLEEVNSDVHTKVPNVLIIVLKYAE